MTFILFLFAIDELLTGGQQIPDSIPVASSTDWQAAFGFSTGSGSNILLGGQQAPPAPQQQPQPSAAHNNTATTQPTTSTSTQDDDLGFDPWIESSKALADLVEKEQGSLQQQQHQHQQAPALSTSPQIKNLPPGFTSNHIGALPQNPCKCWSRAFRLHYLSILHIFNIACVNRMSSLMNRPCTVHIILVHALVFLFLFVSTSCAVI